MIRNKNNILILAYRIEHYHHIVPQSKQGSNTVKNIVGLCKDCHDKVHKDNNISKELSELKGGICKQYEISLLNIIMPYLIDLFNDYCIKNTLSFKTIKGFETKRIRDDLYLDKDHYIDAYVISVSNLTLDYNSRIFYPNILYHQRRYKKKSNGNINKVGSQKYYYNEKLVVVNRHKATEQKEDSLEEHLREYSESHSKKEVERYFHSLQIEPAQRIYTYRKKRETRLIKPGDVVLYYKKLKIGKEKSNSGKFNKSR